MSRSAVREWIDTISGVDLQAARQVQRVIDASVHDRLPEPEVTETDWDQLMPMERALFGAQFQDTLPPAREAA
jgi:hypothetical protein